MSKINVAIGAVAGVAVGTLLGVLFAPDKGTETRKKITSKGKDTSDAIKNKFNEIVHSFSGNGAKSEEETIRMAESGEIN